MPRPKGSQNKVTIEVKDKLHKKTEVFLKDKVVLDQQGHPRKAFYDLTVYKDARSARIAKEYYGCSTAFIDEQGNECFFLHNTVILFNTN